MATEDTERNERNLAAVMAVLPVDYHTAFGGLQEMEQELRALIEGHHAIGDRYERGALSDRAKEVARLASLYSEMMSLLAPPHLDQPH